MDKIKDYVVKKYPTKFKNKTIEVIEEDGIRWYTLDSLCYESIDTTIINYPWGREENYYFKYKES